MRARLADERAANGSSAVRRLKEATLDLDRALDDDESPQPKDRILQSEDRPSIRQVDFSI